MSTRGKWTGGRIIHLGGPFKRSTCGVRTHMTRWALKRPTYRRADHLESVTCVRCVAKRSA